jgi:hypothetical protein
MDDESVPLIERAKAVWSKAQFVYNGPTRLGLPDALQVSLEIAQNHPECHDALLTLLLSESQLVAAYALLTLEAMGSDVVRSLPVELLDCRKQISLQTGSFRNSTDFGGLARQVQKRARQRQPSEGT